LCVTLVKLFSVSFVPPSPNPGDATAYHALHVCTTPHFSLLGLLVRYCKISFTLLEFTLFQFSEIKLI